MKKKILILIPFIFILCGCTAEVNLKIDDNYIKENVNIDVYPDQYYTKEQLPKAFRKYIPAYDETTIVDTMPDEKVAGVKYYNRSEKDLNTGYRFIYDYNFNINSYSQARTVKGAFKSTTIQINKKDKEILLSTDKSGISYFNEYPSLTKITVNIEASYPVKKNNADSVNGNVYTWEFDKNTKKNIYLLMDSKQETNTNNNDKNENKQENTTVNNSNNEEKNAFMKFVNEHPILTAICSILLFILVVSIITKLTKNKY